MGIFSKNNKIEIDKELRNRLQFELNNNSNIEIERKVYSDVKFPYDDKVITIDMLMLTQKGIFIFYSLPREGQYIGGEFEGMWIIGDGKIKNPIEEIKKQYNQLSAFLNIERNKIITYIVISNNATLRDIPYCRKNYRIVKEKDLYYFLGLHTNILQDVFDEKEINNIKKKLNKSNILKELYNN